MLFHLDLLNALFTPRYATQFSYMKMLRFFAHLKIYQAFPDVLGVVHSHTTEVLPFAAANVPLTAQMHTVSYLANYRAFLFSNCSKAGSVGTKGTPIFDTAKLPTSVLPEDQPHDLLIRTAVLGDALAKSFSNDSQVRRRNQLRGLK